MRYIVIEGPKRTTLDSLDRLCEYARTQHGTSAVVVPALGGGDIVAGGHVRATYVVAPYVSDATARAQRNGSLGGRATRSARALGRASAP